MYQQGEPYGGGLLIGSVWKSQTPPLRQRQPPEKMGDILPWDAKNFLPLKHSLPRRFAGTNRGEIPSSLLGGKNRKDSRFCDIMTSGWKTTLWSAFALQSLIHN